MIHEPEPELPTQAVVTDRFDEDDWRFMLDIAPRLGQMIDRVSESHDYMGALCQDIGMLLYQGDPKIRTPEQMNPQMAVNAELIQAMHDLPEIASLRTLTMHNEFYSPMAEQGLESLIVSMKEASQEARDAAEAAQQAAQELAEALAGGGDASGGDGPSVPSEGQIQQMQANADTLAQQAKQAAQDAVQAVSMQMRAAARKTANDVQDDVDLMSAFGQEPGQLQQMSYEERVALADMLKSPKFTEIGDLTGQLRNVDASEARKKVTDVPEQVTDVTLSDDFIRMTGSEMLNLADPTLETEMLARMMNHELMVDEMSGIENMGKGPGIFAGDLSGSMEAALLTLFGIVYSREQYMKALLFALIHHYHRENRDFIYIGFSSAGQTIRVDFPAGQASQEAIRKAVETFFGGGTYYEGPLTDALDIIENEYAGKSKPDIIFVTDDEYGPLETKFLERWNAVKEKFSMRCFGVLLTENGEAISGALDSIADSVRTVTDLSADPTGSNVRSLFHNL